MISKFKAIIFDLDGTLIDSMGLWEEIDRIYLDKFGYDLPKDLQKNIEGKSFDETAIYFKTHFNLMDDVEVIKKDWHDLAEEFYKERVRIKSSVKELLIKIKSLNMPMAIATSNSKELAMMALKTNNIEKYFDAIVTSCEVGKGKPSPDVFLETAKRLNVSPIECLVFEDTHAGVIGAKKAGMTVFAVYDRHSEDFIEKIKESADEFIFNFDEII